MTGVLVRRGNLDTKADMVTGRTACEDKDRVQGDASTSQGMPTFARNPQEARKEA